MKTPLQPTRVRDGGLHTFLRLGRGLGLRPHERLIAAASDFNVGGAAATVTLPGIGHAEAIWR